MGTAVIGIERDSQYYWRKKSQSASKSYIQRLVQIRDDSFRSSGRYTLLIVAVMQQILMTALNSEMGQDGIHVRNQAMLCVAIHLNSSNDLYSK